MAQTLAPMHLAAGALIAAAHAAGARVGFAIASPLPKAERHRRLFLLWPALEGRSNADRRDAIWIGVAALLDARRRWAA
jgi:hypothetical protein